MLCSGGVVIHSSLPLVVDYEPLHHYKVLFNHYLCYVHNDQKENKGKGYFILKHSSELRKWHAIL